jgi:hypothetical protein
VAAGSQNLDLPLSGVLTFVQSIGYEPGSLVAWLHLVELVSWTAWMVAVLASLRSTQVTWPIQLAWFAYSALAIVLSWQVWQSNWHALRALVEWQLLGMLIVLAARNRAWLVPLLTTIPICRPTGNG